MRRGPITKQGSKLMRWAAIEAAQKLCRDSWLHIERERLAERRNSRAIAKTAIARKLITHPPSSRSGCERVVCHDPRTRRGRPLDCVHLIAAEEHHVSYPRGAEMTDTPGHPGEVPVQRTLGDGTQPDNHSSIPERDPLEMAQPRPSQGLAYGETPLDKPRSFRDDRRTNPSCVRCLRRGVPRGRSQRSLEHVRQRHGTDRRLSQRVLRGLRSKGCFTIDITVALDCDAARTELLRSAGGERRRRPRISISG